MKVLLFANTEWYLFNFRQGLASALRDMGHDVLLVSPLGPYSKELQERGFRWIAAPMERRSLNPFSELGLIMWLLHLIRQERVDLVHGFTIKCAVYGSLASRLSGRSMRINAVSGMGYVFCSTDLKARVLRPIVRAVLRSALGGRDSRLILQNPDDVDLFRRADLVRIDRVRLIPGSGVDCTRFTPVAKHREVTELRVLLAARLLWDKGLAEYAEAARQLKQEGRSICFLLAGTPDTGNPAAVSEDTVKAWVDEGLLEWLGHVDDMPTLFSTVDIVVLPSYREGLPKSLIEAAACGLPLVTTDVPGCREVVSHEVEGLLVPMRDGQALARAIARLQDDPALAVRLGAAARQKALKEFDEKIVIERTLSVYRELIPGFGFKK